MAHIVEPGQLELPSEMTNKSACGHWHNTFFMALKWTRGCIMMLEGSVARDLSSHAKQETCPIPHIYECPFPQERDDSRIYM